ncbi:hypothetical protein Cob_v007964 [Colletotrichum orbiculare MAFF 240422]|uniref:Uncharacterized protein n=1 Tax=Colletotrichum orbiculare (strain 104-T / ATCC 96160 / CBS 514.97 / LARS 414 / MAFF 240422) TaxID=1213857 RepID=A0A484FL86_COLOR|nr:hypothetical protein Cob_v007964 [Colletotrichum orbiculare MAFF 240422]
MTFPFQQPDGKHGLSAGERFQADTRYHNEPSFLQASPRRKARFGVLLPEKIHHGTASHSTNEHSHERHAGRFLA